ncbi:MAG: hypothetical protein IPL55_24190 [Saprospiraceae bacterium]|nr:hypothetical protein [Saprospiraceae bacterium]
MKRIQLKYQSGIGGILFKPFTLILSQVRLDILGLVPAMDIATAQDLPMSVTGGWAKVDFATGESETSMSNTVNLPVNAPSTDNLIHAAPTLATGLQYLYC